MCQIRAAEGSLREGRGNCLKYLPRGGIEKRRVETRKLKRRAGQAGLRAGCHKKEKAGNPLRTVHLTQHPMKTSSYSLYFSLIF